MNATLKGVKEKDQNAVAELNRMAEDFDAAVITADPTGKVSPHHASMNVAFRMAAAACRERADKLSGIIRFVKI